MVEQVKTFMQTEWRDLAKSHADFTEAKQAALRKVMNQCAKDFEYPMDKPYDVEHENFNYFALCLRSNVGLTPAINQCQGIR